MEVTLGAWAALKLNCHTEMWIMIISGKVLVEIENPPARHYTLEAGKAITNPAGAKLKIRAFTESVVKLRSVGGAK